MTVARARPRKGLRVQQVARATSDVSAVRVLGGSLSRDVQENGRMHQLVHQADLLRFAPSHVAPGQDHVQRRLQSHRARQPLRATGAGK